MSRIIIDDDDIRALPLVDRLDKCMKILKESRDESLRWDAIWIAGEIAEIAGSHDPLFDKVADLMVWVLQNDDNGVVKHEACYQIAARDMRKKIPDLVNSALYDKSVLVKHEALEALGLIRALESKELIAKSLEDDNKDVRETASFVLKRLNRIQKTSHQSYDIL